MSETRKGGGGDLENEPGYRWNKWSTVEKEKVLRLKEEDWVEAPRTEVFIWGEKKRKKECSVSAERRRGMLENWEKLRRGQAKN